MIEPYTDMPGFRSSPMIEPDIIFYQVEKLDKNESIRSMPASRQSGCVWMLSKRASKKNGKQDMRH
jgi:hypothetical protein